MEDCTYVDDYGIWIGCRGREQEERNELVE
jgi:hypothetical protein